MTQVYVDLDGVLADFDTQYFRVFRQAPNRDAAEPPDMWERIRASGNFFLEMQPMRDAADLWKFVQALKKKPVILTGTPPSMPEAADQKRAWVSKWVGPRVEVICCRSSEKYMHIREPGDILIDDWTKYRQTWLAAGGRWITHTSAKDSIDQLLEMGTGL